MYLYGSFVYKNIEDAILLFQEKLSRIAPISQERGLLLQINV
ncbi:hypothetical protein B488_03960 [Liberibacter crescens BT-1]|uniref:Uncharacterized protein n=1 Tax=Liberibacter crescens (strain BT-1) TaxID=1215343 RepID=L0EUP1_LIBCB|nr:hypothetical protein B488_03960 [Liberibacter crescens BT-1]